MGIWGRITLSIISFALFLSCFVLFDHVASGRAGTGPFFLLLLFAFGTFGPLSFVASLAGVELIYRPQKSSLSPTHDHDDEPAD